MMPDVTFFVPCLNEAPNVRDALETIVAAATEAGVTFEILVVDDGSTDNTAEVVEAYRQEHPELAITLKRNGSTLGLGRNYVDGAFLGRGQYYMLANGDNQQPQESFVAILRQLGQADMIIPYFAGGDGRSWPRRLASRAFVLLVNLLSGQRVHYYNGPVLHRRTNVMRWHPDSPGFGYQAELITRLLGEGATYREVEITNKNRQFGSSHAFRPANLLSVAFSLLKILLRRVERKLFGGPDGGRPADGSSAAAGPSNQPAVAGPAE